MGVISDIAPHVPYLRRFARALTGNQENGDALVAALLESFIADPDKLPLGDDARLALYAAFCRLWETQSRESHLLPENLEDTEWEAKAHRQLAVLEPQAREAFLLMAVEGFDPDEIAEILERSSADVQHLLDNASQSIVEQVATDVLVIEDEPIIAMDLETLLESLGHRITGIARTEEEAIQLSSAQRPGLVLADIKLADGSSGIDAVNRILTKFEVPVIFITAFPERLLTGEKPEPAFLITKPFMPDMVKAVVSQALFFDIKPRVLA